MRAASGIRVQYVTRSIVYAEQMVAQLAKAQGLREKGEHLDDPFQYFVGGEEVCGTAGLPRSTFSNRRSREVLSGAQTQPHSVSGANLTANKASWEGGVCEVQGVGDSRAGHVETELGVGDMVMPIVGEA